MTLPIPRLALILGEVFHAVGQGTGEFVGFVPTEDEIILDGRFSLQHLASLLSTEIHSESKDPKTMSSLPTPVQVLEEVATALDKYSDFLLTNDFDMKEGCPDEDPAELAERLRNVASRLDPPPDIIKFVDKVGKFFVENPPLTNAALRAKVDQLELQLAQEIKRRPPDPTADTDD